MRPYIAQGIGFIGMALVFLGFQQNDKRKILWLFAAAGVAFSAHFFMLGAWTGMAMNLLEIPRNLIFARTSEKRKWFWTAAFIAALAVLGVFTWESLMSLFPLFAMCLSTIVFSLRKPRHIRFCSLPVSALWMIYNVLSRSIAGAMTEAFCLLSIIVAIVRFDILKKESAK